MLEKKHKNIAKGHKSPSTAVFVIESSLFSLFVFYFLVHEYYGFIYIYSPSWEFYLLAYALIGIIGIHQFMTAALDVWNGYEKSSKAYLACCVIYLSLFFGTLFSREEVFKWLGAESTIILVWLSPILLSWWFTSYQIRKTKESKIESNIDQEDILDFFE
ncbi:MAG: hypothetical protein AAF741_18900 [Bacteroidota bacterium]